MNICRGIGAVGVLGIALFVLSVHPVGAQSRVRGEVTCPAVIGERESGDYASRSKFRCFASARAAKRAGYTSGSISSLGNDLSGTWRLHLLPVRNGCSELLGPRVVDLDLEQEGSDLTAILEGDSPRELQGFRVQGAQSAVLASQHEVACDVASDGVADELITITVGAPRSGQFESVTLKIERMCKRYCVDILEGTAERR